MTGCHNSEEDIYIAIVGIVVNQGKNTCSICLGFSLQRGLFTATEDENKRRIQGDYWDRFEVQELIGANEYAEGLTIR
jgi:hypothetical protein